MNVYNEEFEVIGFNNELKKPLNGRLYCQKRAIYIKDVGIDIQKGYKLMKRYNSGYVDEFLVVDVTKKRSLTGIVVIYIMRV
jgi:hypothetical protein